MNHCFRRQHQVLLAQTSVKSLQSCDELRRTSTCCGSGAHLKLVGLRHQTRRPTCLGHLTVPALSKTAPEKPERTRAAPWILRRLFWRLQVGIATRHGAHSCAHSRALSLTRSRACARVHVRACAEARLSQSVAITSSHRLHTHPQGPVGLLELQHKYSLPAPARFAAWQCAHCQGVAASMGMLCAADGAAARRARFCAVSSKEKLFVRTKRVCAL